MRKPNSNAKLKTLPEDRQAAIFERLNLPTKEGGGYQNTLKWLRDDGLETSLGALSEFFSWYRLNQRLTRNGSTVEQLLKDLKSAKPDMTPEELDVAGQMFFSALSIDQEDSLSWKRVQDAKTRRDVFKLNREKWEFDAAKLCLKLLPDLRVISTNKTLSDPQKVEQFRMKLFGVTP